MDKCKKCSECEGGNQLHHWLEDYDEEAGMISCKHCDAQMEMTEETSFFATENGIHQFYFVCEGCGTEGPLALEVDRISRRIHCPEECGAIYVLWDDPIKEQPALMGVVIPVFA